MRMVVIGYVCGEVNALYRISSTGTGSGTEGEGQATRGVMLARDQDKQCEGLAVVRIVWEHDTWVAGCGVR